jgi:hypothetical protein
LRVCGAAGAAGGTGVARKRSDGDLRHVNERRALLLVKDVEKDSLRDSSNEAANVVFADEEWHGLAVEFPSHFFGLMGFELLSLAEVETAVPSFATAFYGNKRGPKGAFRRRHDFHL